MDNRKKGALKRKMQCPRTRQPGGLQGYNLQFVRNRKQLLKQVQTNSIVIADTSLSCDENEHVVSQDMPHCSQSVRSGFCQIEADTKEQAEPTRTHDNFIYDGCGVGYDESRKIILALLLKHNLPLDACEDLIAAINTHLPTPALPASKYLFFKHLNYLLQKIEKFYFCPQCNVSLGKNLKGTICCSSCCYRIVICNVTTYYAHIGLKHQLELFFLLNPEILDAVLKNLESRDFNGRLSDICDGEIIQNLRKSSGNKFLSLTFCSDGFQVGKSKRSSLWPFMFQLNELPKRIRFHNLFLMGMWEGNSSVPAHGISPIIVKDLNELTDLAIAITVSGNTTRIPVRTVCGCFDSQLVYG